MQIKPKKHQQDALKKIKQALIKHRRAQVTMACGTGKSYVAAWTVQAHAANSVLVLVPSLALVRQLKDSFEKVFSYPAVAVCSDRTIAANDDVKVSEAELGCRVTTDANVVKEHLAQPGKRLVYCTYQSAPKLKGFKFDLGIFDEAHKTAGWQHKSFGFPLHDKNIRIKHRVFFTATPRVSRATNDEVASMDDVKVYGPKVYELPFRKAVKRGLICDYRLVISEINEDVDTQHHAALQVAIQKAMDARGIKKVFAFFRTVDQARVFATDTAGFDPSVTVLHVNGAMSTEERNGVIAQFEKADRAVLTNARCLTEGVDVPAVDMVVFAQAKRSTIDIVQAAGRAMRNSPGKERGYIFLPVWRNAAAGETFDTAVSREGFKPVLDTLRALASQDALLESLLDVAGVQSAPTRGLAETSLIEYTASTAPAIDALRRAVAHSVIARRVPAGYWTIDRIRVVAKKCKTRRDLQQRFPAAHAAARRWGVLDDLIPLAVRRWTRKELIEIARKYSSAGRYRFKEENYGAYQAALTSEYRDEIFAMIPSKVGNRIRRKWTTDELLTEARKYSRAVDLRTGNYSVYVACYRRDLLWTVFEKGART